MCRDGFFCYRSRLACCRCRGLLGCSGLTRAILPLSFGACGRACTVVRAPEARRDAIHGTQAMMYTRMGQAALAHRRRRTLAFPWHAAPISQAAASPLHSATAFACTHTAGVLIETGIVLVATNRSEHACAVYYPQENTHGRCYHRPVGMVFLAASFRKGMAARAPSTFSLKTKSQNGDARTMSGRKCAACGASLEHLIDAHAGCRAQSKVPRLPRRRPTGSGGRKSNAGRKEH